MIRLLQIIFILVLVFFMVRLVRLLINYFSSSSRPTIDDLKNQQGNYKSKMRDIEEADFREIPPEENDNSKT